MWSRSTEGSIGEGRSLEFPSTGHPSTTAPMDSSTTLRDADFKGE
ncbi:hypothetical protein [Polaromonas sp.]